MSSLRQTPLTCSGHTRPITNLAFSEITKHGYFLISACKDGKPMLRQGDTGDWIGTFEGHKGAVWSSALNRDATKAATGAADFSVKIWDALSGEELETFQHKHIVKSVSFSHDEGTRLLTGSNEKIVRVYDLNRPSAEPQTFAGHSGAIKAALYTHDHRQILTAADDKTVRLFDVASGQEVNRMDIPSNPTDLELSQDSSVITVSFGRHVSFWDTSFHCINSFEMPTTINSASLHPSKDFYVCGGEDFKMYKCSYGTGEEVESFKGHFGPVHCVRFSPDGELYASGSEDGTLRLWQTCVGKTYGLWKCVNPSAEAGAMPMENGFRGVES